MATVKLYLNDDDNQVEMAIDGGNPQPVLICSLHKVSSNVPYKEDWEVGQRDQLNDWAVLPPVDIEGSDFPEELKDNIKSVQRPNGLQATYNDYQLYYYQGSTGDGTSPGFWEIATLDRMNDRPTDEKCPDRPTDPRISRGP